MRMNGSRVVCACVALTAFLTAPVYAGGTAPPTAAVRVEREKAHWLARAVTWNIVLNGTVIGSLDNGETKSFSAPLDPAGKNKVHVEGHGLGLTTSSAEQEFDAGPGAQIRITCSPQMSMWSSTSIGMTVQIDDAGMLPKPSPSIEAATVSEPGVATPATMPSAADADLFSTYVGTWKSAVVDLSAATSFSSRFDKKFITGTEMILKLATVAAPQGSTAPPVLAGYLITKQDLKDNEVIDLLSYAGLPMDPHPSRMDIAQTSPENGSVRAKLGKALFGPKELLFRIDPKDPDLLYINWPGCPGQQDTPLRRVDRSNSPPLSRWSWYFSSDRMK